jgi:hypothetical protein
MCLAFVDVECELHRRAEVTQALAAVPEIVTIEEAASNRDLMLTVLTGPSRTSPRPWRPGSMTSRGW